MKDKNHCLMNKKSLSAVSLKRNIKVLKLIVSLFEQLLKMPSKDRNRALQDCLQKTEDRINKKVT